MRRLGNAADHAVSASPGITAAGAAAAGLLAPAPRIQVDAELPDRVSDVAIAGGGVAGLTAALLFLRAGRSVVVLEGDRVGRDAAELPGDVTQLQGARLSEVRARMTAGATAAYAESQRDAAAWLADYAEARDLGAERRDALSYATTEGGAALIRREFALGRTLGLPLELAASASLPWRTTASVRLRDQLQVDPARLVATLTADVRAAGGVVVERTRVGRVRATDPVRISTTRGEVLARQLIVATGSPILDRGLYFAKLQPRRRSVLAVRLPHEAPGAMATGVDDGHSLRRRDGLLVVSGAEHGVGRAGSEAALAGALAHWTRRWWPEAEPVAAWSLELHETPHLVPFVGWMPRGRGRVFLATGFGPWGITNAVAAALTLVADATGTTTGWQRTLHRRLTLPAAMASGLGEQLAVGAWYARSWSAALSHRAPLRVGEGEGVIGRDGLRPVAVTRIGERDVRLCAVCPHQGAVVRWNDAEQGWDCPAHGSRFAADGAVLAGPATRGLRPAPSSPGGGAP